MRILITILTLLNLLMAYGFRGDASVYPYFLLGTSIGITLIILWPWIERSVTDANQ